MTREEIRQAIAELSALVESPGYARLAREAAERRKRNLEKLRALRETEANVRHLIRYNAADKENEELMEWAEDELKSLRAAAERA